MVSGDQPTMRPKVKRMSLLCDIIISECINLIKVIKMGKVIHWKRPGYLIFGVTILLAIIELIHMEVIADLGYPNSDQGEAAYYYNIRGVILTIVCCTIIVYILLTEHSGYYRAILLWCMLIAGLCLCLVGVIRSLVWLSFDEAHKLDEMGNHTRNRFEGGLGLSTHERETIRKYKCCGVKNIMIWRHIIDARKPQPDEHDLDEKQEFDQKNGTLKEERRGAHIPDECCSQKAYEGCGEAQFIKIIDYLEEPNKIMKDISDEDWIAFQNNGYRPLDSSYISFNVSDPRILIPNDEISLWSLPGVKRMCDDVSVDRKRLYIYHVGLIYKTDPTKGKQGAPCLLEDSNSTDCFNSSIRFEFSSVRAFCLYVSHTLIAETDIVNEIAKDGFLYTTECGKWMIPYIDGITAWTLVYSSVLLVMLVLVMIVFHKMYIELRLEQLKEELPPRWYKPFENEEGQILGFGDVPHIPESERLRRPDEPPKEYAKPPIGKYRGPRFSRRQIEKARREEALVNGGEKESEQGRNIHQM